MLIVGLIALICSLLSLSLSWGIDGYLAIIFCIIISLWIIYKGLIKALKKMNSNSDTLKRGEECYAKILDCVGTGFYIFAREVYKIIVVVYIPSIKKKIIIEENVGFINYKKYVPNSYLKVLYYNNDINIGEMVNENEIPNDILNILNDSSVNSEFTEYVMIKEEEKIQEENSQREKFGVATQVFGYILAAIPIGLFYLFSICLIFFNSPSSGTSYFNETIYLMKNFIINLPLSIMYPLSLIISLTAIVPMILNSHLKRLFFLVLWFVSICFIIMYR